MRNFLLAMSIDLDGELTPMNHPFSAPQLTMASLERGVQEYINEITLRARQQNPGFCLMRECVTITNVIELDPTYDDDEDEEDND